MRILLDIALALTDDGSDRWWRDPRLFTELAGAAERAGLWLGFHRVTTAAGKDVEPIGGPAELAGLAVRWKPQIYILHSAETDGSSLQLVLRSAGLRIQLEVSRADAERRRGDLLDRMIDLAVDLRSSLAGRVVVEPESCVRPLGLDYAAPRPPRANPAFASGTLVDFLDPAGLERRDATLDGQELRPVLTKVRRARLPRGAARFTRKGLLILRWLNQPLDEDSVARACVAQEKWLGSALGAPPPEGSSEGDEVVTTGPMNPLPPLTFYDRMQRHGYKTLGATGTGMLDEDEWREIAAWTRAGALPDGTPLDEVRIVLPSRPAALRLRPRAERDGVAKVLYIGDDGQFWDPFPAPIDDGDDRDADDDTGRGSP